MAASSCHFSSWYSHPLAWTGLLFQSRRVDKVARLNSPAVLTSRPLSLTNKIIQFWNNISGVLRHWTESLPITSKPRNLLRLISTFTRLRIHWIASDTRQKRSSQKRPKKVLKCCRSPIIKPWPSVQNYSCTPRKEEFSSSRVWRSLFEDVMCSFSTPLRLKSARSFLIFQSSVVQRLSLSLPTLISRAPIL